MGQGQVDHDMGPGYQDLHAGLVNTRSAVVVCFHKVSINQACCFWNRRKQKGRKIQTNSEGRMRNTMESEAKRRSGTGLSSEDTGDCPSAFQTKVCVCVCVCVCACTYVYVHVFVYVSVCTCVYMHVSLCVPAHVYMHVCMTEHVCTCMYLYMGMCAFTCICICVYECMFAHVMWVHACVCVYVCLHRCIHVCVCVCACTCVYM